MMRRLVETLSILGGWALILYTFLVGFEIVGRRFFGYSLQGVDEIGGYLMAVVVALGFSHALYHRAHIRIDLLLARLSRPLTMWLNVAALASLAVFAIFLTGRAWTVVVQSYEMGAVSSTPLLTPLVVPQSVWIAALVLFVLAACSRLVRVLRHALRGEADAVADAMGSSAGRPPSPTDRS